jgi:hypothetical protein
MKRQNLEKINSSNYQSLYLWTSFLLGMISWGVVIWQRSSGVTLSPSFLRVNSTRDLLPRHLSEIPRYTRKDNFVITYTTPLILGALSYQPSGSVASGLLFGLGSYIHEIAAQVDMPALTINLNNLKTDEGVIFTGGQYTGYSVYATGIDKQNRTNLIIGAPGANKAYLVQGPNFPVTNLDLLSSPQGKIFNGGGYTGYASYLADMNDDGYIDILIGAFYAGKTYLVYGPEYATMLDNLSSQQGIIFMGKGYTVYAADINKDNYLDILIGTGDYKVYLIYGPNFTNVGTLDSLSSDRGLIFSGGIGTGASLYATDINGDTHVDLLIGAYDFPSGSTNKVYLVYGPDFATATMLDNISGKEGLILQGAVGTGFSVYATDINKDGNADILIGTYLTAKTYLVYGPDFSNSTFLDNLNISQGVVFNGGGYRPFAADMNGDSYVDLLIGSITTDNVYLVYGPNFSAATTLSNLQFNQGVIFTGDRMTGASLYAADLNADQRLDVIIGNDISKVYVAFNSKFNLFPPTTSTTLTLPVVTTTQNRATSLTASNTAPSNLNTVNNQTINSQATINQAPITTIIVASIIPAGENTSPPPEKNTTPLYAGIGGGVGELAVLLGGVGLFACYQKNNKKKKEQQSKNNDVSLATKENISTSSVVTAQENNSDRTASARLNYNRLDEVKKSEQQYDSPTKLEI